MREDQLVPLGDMRAMVARLPNAELHEISSVYGHDAFLKENRRLAPIFANVLNDTSGTAPVTTTLTPDTRAVRAGLENCDVTGAVVPPLHLSSTYAFRGFGDKRKYDYSRSGNPTRDLLAEALDGSRRRRGRRRSRVPAWARSRSSVTCCPSARASSRRTIAMAARSACSPPGSKRGELAVEFVDFGNAAAVDAALSKPAALVWIETPSNPLLRITDIADIATARPRHRRAGGGRQHLPVAGLAAAASRSAPTSSCTRPRSTSTATATWSAAR